MKQIMRLLDFVENNNTFYHDLINGKPNILSEYPVITKDTLKMTNNLISTPYNNQTMDLLCMHTSGSTGVPIEVYWNQGQYFQSIRTLWKRRKLFYGITPLSRKVEFVLKSEGEYNCKEVKYNIKNNGLISIDCSSISTSSSMEHLYSIISRFKPEWMYVQPSILRHITYFFNKNQFPNFDSLKYIESIGEILTCEIKEEAQAYFKVPVVNMYGSIEMNGIAYECPYHKLHIISDNVKVEVLKNGKLHDCGEGEIILTNLHNYVMPLIHYKQGDIVELSENTVCECGFDDPIVNVMYGRERESVVIKSDDGDYILNNFKLCDCISMLNSKYKNVVKQFQFIYTEVMNELIIKLYIANYDEFLREQIKDELTLILLQKGIKNIKLKYDISTVDDLFISGTKHQIFVLQ